MNEPAYNPSEYARAVQAFSKLESGIGQHFDLLADFLLNDEIDAPDGAAFATVYQFQNHPPLVSTCLRRHETSSWHDFEALNMQIATGSNSLVFLRGFPSSQWLRGLGSTFGIDPEFFRRHLDFHDTSNKSDALMVSLPSSQCRICRLNVTTMQTAGDVTRHDVKAESRRKLNDKGMKRYKMKLLRQDMARGDPIVRNFSTIDTKCFAIEQQISFYLCELEKNWIANRNDPTNEKSTPEQTASLVHTEYGRTLNLETAAHDTSYALREVFELVMQAEAQFLAICGTKLREFQTTDYSEDEDCLPNLKNLKQLLYRHLQQNQEAYATLEIVASPDWPKAKEDRMRQRSETSVATLRKDFSVIIENNERMHRYCTEAINVLMNEIVIAESTSARLQATRLSKLTFLAFIFVPLSFTTSFFGMNFQELGASQDSLRIYVWFLLSVPLLTCAIILYVYDFKEILAVIMSPRLTVHAVRNFSADGMVRRSKV